MEPSSSCGWSRIEIFIDLVQGLGGTNPGSYLKFTGWFTEEACLSRTEKALRVFVLRICLLYGLNQT